MLTGQVASTARTDSLRAWARRYGYGTVLMGSFFILWWGYESSVPLEQVAIGVQIAAIIAIVSLEFLVPYQPRWGTIRDVTRADVGYFLMAPLIDQLQILGVVALLAGTAAYHHHLAVFDFWPGEAHFLIQLLLATLVVDFFKYWYHRWTHEVPLLWRMHSIHHSLDRLEMLRASYFFPLDLLITVGTGSLVLLSLGVDYEILVFHNVWAGITGLLNHSNTDLECGFFDVFLNSPGHHRAHHSIDEPGSRSNYGSFFNFTDRVFGTRYLPDREEMRHHALGLDDSYDMPKTLVEQLKVPWRWEEVHKADEA